MTEEERAFRDAVIDNCNSIVENFYEYDVDKVDTAIDNILAHWPKDK